MFLLINSTTGCLQQAEFHKDVPKFKIDPELQPYVDYFENDMNMEVKINMSFYNQTDTVVAICYFYDKNPELNYIEVDPIQWNHLDENGKEEVIFHELGHCLMGKEHDSMFLEKYNVPKSIMYPYVFSTAYGAHKPYYVEELKNPELDWTIYFQ